LRFQVESFLERFPRAGLLLAVPLAVFLLSIGLALAMGGGSSRAPDSVQVSVQSALPTSTPSTPPTATPPAYRTDCAQIFGSNYQSDDERSWFLANCNGAQPKNSTGGGNAATGGTTASHYAVETALGDRLVIQKIGVNAPVSRAAVLASGVMPDPTGYFNAVLYDFAALPGLGGAPGVGGNAVFAGHVDCAACGPGGTPGAAVFYYMRNLVPGDVIEYYTQSGAYFKYVVSYVADLPPDADWASIVAAGSADMTLITCSGVFQSAVHEYTTRRVIQAKKA
jgi:hypothetical protein